MRRRCPPFDVLALYTTKHWERSILRPSFTPTALNRLIFRLVPSPLGFLSPADIRGNALGDLGLAHLIDALSSPGMHQLEQLDVQHNNLTTDGLVSLRGTVKTPGLCLFPTTSLSLYCFATFLLCSFSLCPDFCAWVTPPLWPLA